MISTIVKRETLRDVEAGAGLLTFDDKPHWRKRLTPWHRAIMLLSGGRCRVYRVERIEDGGGHYRVVLGGRYTWPRQARLFDGE